MTHEEKLNLNEVNFDTNRGLYYFDRDRNSVLKPTPATSRLIRLCYEEDFSPRNVIDLGCGNGRNSLAIANEFGCKLTLVDKDPRFLRRAVEKIENIGHQIENARVSEIENLDLEDFKHFDIVLFNYVLQNIHPKHFEYVFTVIHSLAKHYAVVDIYQNPSIYENGVYSYRGAIGWYGFSIDEIIALMNSGFDIEWGTGSLAWKGSTTLSYILTPLDEFCTIPFARYKKKIPVEYLPKRRTSLRRSFQQRNVSNNEYKNSYPPCKECTSEKCSEYSCEILNRWAKSPILFHNEIQKFSYYDQQVDRNFFSRNYPICTHCQMDKCLGFNCSRLITFSNQIKAGEIKQNSSSKRIEEELQMDNHLPLEYKNEIDLTIESLTKEYPNLKKLSSPAIIYLATRIKHIPLSLAEICYYFNVKKNKVYKEISCVQKFYNLPFTPVDYIDYVNRFSKTLPLSPDNINIIKKILQHINNNIETRQHLKRGSSLVTAAAIINYSIQKSQKNLSLSLLSKKLKVSEASIRNRRRHLQKILSTTQFEL